MEKMEVVIDTAEPSTTEKEEEEVTVYPPTVPAYKETYIKQRTNAEVIARIVQKPRPCRVDLFNPDERPERTGIVPATEKVNELYLLNKRDYLVQKSQKWEQRRRCRITASSVSDIIRGPKRGGRGAKWKELMWSKLDQSERKENEAIKHGNSYEKAAIRMYEKITKETIIHFGAMGSLNPDEPHFLASPDGITTNDILVEVKCPYARCPNGDPKTEYMDQIQFMLHIWDLDLCHFVEFIPADHTWSKDGIFRVLTPNVDDLFDEEMFDYDDPNHHLDIIEVPRDPQWIIQYKPLMDEFYREYTELRALPNLEELIRLGQNHENQDPRLKKRETKARRLVREEREKKRAKAANVPFDKVSLITIDEIEHPDWSAPFRPNTDLAIDTSFFRLPATRAEIDTNKESGNFVRPF
jgi:hypothetical protein